MLTTNRLLPGILLVAGTTIGGGMLALPILTGAAGFLPALVVYILCWAFMVSTGLLMLEVCFWTPPEANLVTMGEKTLGFLGKWSAWILYIFLYYCLTLAYIAGCGGLIVETLQGQIPAWMGSVIFILLFAPIVIAGDYLVGRINIFLMTGLLISYSLFVVLGLPNVNFSLLLDRDWSATFKALPIAFAASAYQGVIPSLLTYLKRDRKQTRLAIIIGSTIPLIMYMIWQLIILGIVPKEAPGGLEDALRLGQNAVQPLKLFLERPEVYTIGQFLAFFALTTSFLGVTLGLWHFLADGLKIHQTGKNKILLAFLVFGPPLALAITYPHTFLIALDYAGGYGCALLLGLLPILMVWSGRYFLKLPYAPALPGGRPILILLLIFVLIELASEMLHGIYL